MKKFALFCCVLISICLLAVSAKSAITPEMMVGMWLFDQDGQALDTTGKGHDGKAEGNIKWVDGKFGKAVELDGNSAIVIEHKEDMNLEKFTLMAWVKIPTAPTDWWTIAAKDGWPNRNYGIWLASGSGLAHHSWTSGAAPNNNAINAVTPVTASEWFHVTATYDMVDSKLYINGNLDAQGSFTDKPNATDVQFIIGRTANGSYKLVGVVDEVALFNQALDENDINEIIANGLTPLMTSVTPKAKLATTWSEIKIH